uniref:ORF2 n=1 Tax=Torque teno sus virus 1a TaxID=687386 RepID=G3FE02_9VIRU|nr:ORF2 [Torque teno sus virus 1a]
MKEKDYWEEWLTSCTSIHDHCNCASWRHWTLCALDDDAAAADNADAAADTERGEDGVDMGGVGDGLPGDVGG